jgi:hypothetical protein
VNADGSILKRAQHLGDADSLTSSGLPPAAPSGGAVFFAADQRYSSIAASMYGGDQLPKRLKAPAADEIASYNSARSITFTLDSVLFADGKFAGADTDHRFEDYTDQLAAQASMSKAVLPYQGHSVDDLRQFLASVPRSGNRWLKRIAGRYSGILQVDGSDSLFQL